MHMQEGIGRNGYRVLSGVFFGLGLLGLGSTLYAFPPSPDLFDWLGFSLSLVAFAVLFGLILVVLQKPLGARPMTVKPVADTATAKPPAAAPPVPPTPAAKPATPSAASPFEYTDAAAAPSAAPTQMVLPAAFQSLKGPEVAVPVAAPKDPRSWPERTAPNATRKELGDRYTQNTPMVREILAATTGGTQVAMQAPTVLARTLPNEEAAAPANASKGRCGGCGTVLVAPRTRPINLRCPRCDKVTLLK